MTALKTANLRAQDLRCSFAADLSGQAITTQGHHHTKMSGLLVQRRDRLDA